MRSPSIIPGFDVEVCIVRDDFGKLGRCYRETDEEAADRETVIKNIIAGDKRPARLVSFNTSEGWAQDITEDIACEIQDRADRAAEPLTGETLAFVDRATAGDMPVRPACISDQPVARLAAQARPQGQT